MDDTRVKTLLGRIAAEDQAAFAELYKGFSRKVFAYVLNQLGDAARAEEVVVDTMYEVWRSPTRFRGDSKFTTWLFGIARNKVLMAFRGRRADEDHEDLETIAETATADTPDSFAQLAARQHSDGVRSCVGELGRSHRECVHFVYYEGLAVAEVAKVVGIPEGTVKSRLHHALSKIEPCLKRLLEREGAPGRSAS